MSHSKITAARLQCTPLPRPSPFLLFSLIAHAHAGPSLSRVQLAGLQVQEFDVGDTFMSENPANKKGPLVRNETQWFQHGESGGLGLEVKMHMSDGKTRTHCSRYMEGDLLVMALRSSPTSKYVGKRYFQRA